VAAANTTAATPATTERSPPTRRSRLAPIRMSQVEAAEAATPQEPMPVGVLCAAALAEGNGAA
jgi:hypothetical protein